jgi:hypothetical protein
MIYTSFYYYFYIKNKFRINFSDFIDSWTGRQIQGRTGASAYNILRLRIPPTGRWVVSVKAEGLV